MKRIFQKANFNIDPKGGRAKGRMGRFERRSFDACVYVQIKLKDPKDFKLITAILTYCIENGLWNFCSTTITGRGMYSSLHTARDAAMIKKFVNNWVKENP